MADELDIDPEFEDDDEFLNNLNRNSDSSSNTSGIENDFVIPQGMGFFGFDKKQKNKDVENAQRAAARRRAQEVSDKRLHERERAQDAERARRHREQDARRASIERMKDLRSDATAARIQAYSLGSVFGVQGYVFSNIVDSMFIRPGEEQAAAREKQYQQELQEYNRRVQAQEVENRRRAERDIRNTPIDAIPLDSNGRPIPVSRGLQPPGGRPSAGGPPPIQQPPLVPPTPPGGGKGALGGLGNTAGALGSVAMGVTALIEAGRRVNNVVDNISNSAGQFATQAISGNAIGASKAGLQAFQNIADPIGANVALNVAVDGFSTLLDINQSILNSVKSSIAFSPQTLRADVEGEILRLNKQIETSQKLDKVTAQLIEANTQLDLAFADLRVTLIENLGPQISGAVRLLTRIIELVDAGVDVASNNMIYLSPLAWAVGKILERIEDKADDLDNTDIMQEINDFFDVDLTIGRVAPGSLPKGI